MLRLIFLQEEHKMDSQNETAQLRYLEETSIRLRRMDFESATSTIPSHRHILSRSSLKSS